MTVGHCNSRVLVALICSLSIQSCVKQVCVYRKHLKIKCIHCSIMLNRSSEAQACCQVEPNIWYGLIFFPCSSPISPQTHCLFHESSERCECSVLTRPECQALATTESGDTRRADIVTHCRTKSTSHLPESTQYFQCKQCDKVQTCPGIAFEPCQRLRKIYRIYAQCKCMAWHSSRDEANMEQLVAVASLLRPAVWEVASTCKVKHRSNIVWSCII